MIQVTQNAQDQASDFGRPPLTRDPRRSRRVTAHHRWRFLVPGRQCRAERIRTCASGNTTRKRGELKALGTPPSFGPGEMPLRDTFALCGGVLTGPGCSPSGVLRRPAWALPAFTSEAHPSFQSVPWCGFLDVILGRWKQNQ